MPLDCEVNIEKNAPVRLLNAVMERMDYSKLYAAYSRLGRIEYSPKILLKIMVYGYMHKQIYLLCRGKRRTVCQREAEHMTRVLNALPDTFPETLSMLMTQSGITEENLEERSGISVRTISRLRREERSNYSMDQVITLCIALQLPPWLSAELLDRAGLLLRRTKQHRAYRLILDCMFMDTLDTVQSFLRASGCEALKLKAT